MEYGVEILSKETFHTRYEIRYFVSYINIYFRESGVFDEQYDFVKEKPLEEVLNEIYKDYNVINFDSRSAEREKVLEKALIEISEMRWKLEHVDEWQESKCFSKAEEIAKKALRGDWNKIINI